MITKILFADKGVAKSILRLGLPGNRRIFFSFDRQNDSKPLILAKSQ